MDILWGGMIAVGILYAAFHGTLPEVTDAALNSAKEAVGLCVTMTGVMAFWSGIMKIAEGAGILSGAAKKLAPILRFLFPEIPKNHLANQYIATNMIANVFGLGWAATPAGLKAMEQLAELENTRREESIKIQEKQKRKPKDKRFEAGTASDEMCIFLIMNISSLQLIPVNIIAYRSQYGSASPTAVIGPAIAATAVSTLAAVLFCLTGNRFLRYKRSHL